MGVLQVIAFSLMLASTQAFWFSRGTPVATSDNRPVDQACLELADQGSCEFYSCFERRLPCGRDWYILKHGQYYCNKMEREKPNFSPEGQQFLEDAQRCMTQRLKDLYQREYVDCHALEHEAVASITPCFVDNAFCSVFRNDAEHFFEIYELSDLFTRGAGKVWRQIAALTARCGTEYIRDFSAETHENVMQSVNGMVESISESIDAIRDD